MQAHQKNKGGNERILTYMLREYRQPKDFESFVYLSQVQQAEIIKIGAEHLRRQTAAHHGFALLAVERLLAGGFVGKHRLLRALEGPSLLCPALL